MVGLLRFAAVVALGGIATAGLSACSGADSGVETVSPSVPVVVSEAPSVTPSVSPTPIVTPEEELLARIPEEARYESFPSAVQFAQFFIAEWDAMYRSRDTELFAFLSTDTCTFCDSSLEDVRDIVDGNHVFAGDPVTFVPTEPRGGIDRNGHMNVTLDITVAPSTVSNAFGEIVHEYPEEHLTAAVVLTFGESGWRVVDVGSEPR